jgi:hypothetical protein
VATIIRVVAIKSLPFYWSNHFSPSLCSSWSP